jgi:hypothetical protein
MKKIVKTSHSLRIKPAESQGWGRQALSPSSSYPFCQKNIIFGRIPGILLESDNRERTGFFRKNHDSDLWNPVADRDYIVTHSLQKIIQGPLVRE